MAVPKLRFKEFDQKWGVDALQDQIDFLAGYAFDSKLMSNEPQKYQLIKMSNVYQNQLDLTRNPSYWTNIDSKIEKFLLKKGDIVLTLTGTVGKTDYGYNVEIDKDDKFLLNQRLVRLRAKQDLSDSKFIQYRISTDKFFYHFFYSSKGGTGNQSNVSIEDLKQLELNFPSKAEQTKIATFLSAVDEKISQLTQKHALLSQYKQGMMQKLFSQQIRFKADDGSEFGEWRNKKVIDLFVEIKDKVLNQDIETYSITAGKGFVSQAEKFGRDISGQQNSNYIVLKPQDFSYNKGNSKTYKYGCVYLNEFDYSIAVPNVFISFRAKNINEVNQKFYAKLFEYHYLDKHLRLLISSSARMDGLLNVSKDGFFEINVPYPCLEEQTKIANFLSAIDQKIEVVVQQIEQAKQWKKGLLQQMFV
ncbi:restriction endonuclease subunit S [Acinetobacter sp. F-1]|uniref:restriction endonuclease subunit S n=1 Tax=Acinetobacter sp. F-1 TaxID=1796981 RepID=UPI001FD0BE04|nr:restriction endonuclease subunit S [Acinetobacter sp. F-1]